MSEADPLHPREMSEKQELFFLDHQTHLSDIPLSEAISHCGSSSSSLILSFQHDPRFLT